MNIDRRYFLQLLGFGGAAFIFGSQSILDAEDEISKGQDFIFFQLSDTHWGFNDPKVNPDWMGTLKKVIATVNNIRYQPDFIIFTGDLTHTTDDPKERRERMSEVRDIIGGLTVKNIKFMPGEHDAGLDNGEAFKEYFGKTHYTFDHKGVHFIVLDNVSDPTSTIGETQLQWLSSELKTFDKESQIIVFTHRPLYDLYPQWDWWTRDGSKAVELLMPYRNGTVFHGHIHQEYHHMTGHIAHHAAKGMMYPLPAPGSAPKRAPVPWDPAEPYKGLGYRGIKARFEKAEYEITEYPVKG